MGILQQIINKTAEAKSGAIDSAPKGDDINGVDDQIWNFLCPKSFSNIKKQSIREAIERAYLDVEADRMLADLNALDTYGKNSKSEFNQLLKDILSRIDRYKIAKGVKPLKNIRPGGKIAGGTTGSIGGFLINKNNEIFLFGDAHVMTQSMAAPVGKSTPRSLQRDTIKKNGVEIAVVVCSTEMKVGGNRNYDMALAKIDPQYYKYISLQYQGNRVSPSDAKRFIVSKVDDNLVDNKPVYLFGNATGYREGKLLTSKAADVPKCPYDKFIGSSGSQDVTVHDCIKVISVKDHTVTREGDSGGLWVNEKGEAVALQIMIADDSTVAFVHPMKVVMDYFHNNYDGSLRFLTESDLSSAKAP